MQQTSSGIETQKYVDLQPKNIQANCISSTDSAVITTVPSWEPHVGFSQRTTISNNIPNSSMFLKSNSLYVGDTKEQIHPFNYAMIPQPYREIQPILSSNSGLQPNTILLSDTPKVSSTSPGDVTCVSVENTSVSSVSTPPLVTSSLLSGSLPPTSTLSENSKLTLSSFPTITRFTSHTTPSTPLSPLTPLITPSPTSPTSPFYTHPNTVDPQSPSSNSLPLSPSLHVSKSQPPPLSPLDDYNINNNLNTNTTSSVRSSTSTTSSNHTSASSKSSFSRKSRKIRPKVQVSKGAIQCRGMNRKKGIRCRNAALMEYFGTQPLYCAEHIDQDPNCLYTKCKSPFQKVPGDDKGCREVVLKEFEYCHKHFQLYTCRFVGPQGFALCLQKLKRVEYYLERLEKEAAHAKGVDPDLYQRKNKLIPKFQEMRAQLNKRLVELETQGLAASITSNSFSSPSASSFVSLSSNSQSSLFHMTPLPTPTPSPQYFTTLPSPQHFTSLPSFPSPLHYTNIPFSFPSPHHFSSLPVSIPNATKVSRQLSVSTTSGVESSSGTTQSQYQSQSLVQSYHQHQQQHQQHPHQQSNSKGTTSDEQEGDKTNSKTNTSTNVASPQLQRHHPQQPLPTPTQQQTQLQRLDQSQQVSDVTSDANATTTLSSNSTSSSLPPLSTPNTISMLISEPLSPRSMTPEDEPSHQPQDLQQQSDPSTTATKTTTTTTTRTTTSGISPAIHHTSTKASPKQTLSSSLSSKTLVSNVAVELCSPNVLQHEQHSNTQQFVPSAAFAPQSSEHDELLDENVGLNMYSENEFFSMRLVNPLHNDDMFKHFFEEKDDDPINTVTSHTSVDLEHDELFKPIF